MSEALEQRLEAHKRHPDGWELSLTWDSDPAPGAWVAAYCDPWGRYMAYAEGATPAAAVDALLNSPNAVTR
jgi:hypothetical protein